MAGMLPGVECARRRRFHQGSNSSGSMEQQSGSRRSSFCLYTTGYDSHLTSTSIMTRTINKEIHEATLNNIAREAKERLDARLLRIKSSGNIKSTKMMQNSALVREVYSNKKNTKKFMSCGKFSWKDSDQVECVICLDEFKCGEVLVHLQCDHRFHWNCAMTWIESSSICPCCRTIVINT